LSNGLVSTFSLAKKPHKYRMAQIVSVSLKTVCKDDPFKVNLGPEFGSSDSMATCPLQFTADNVKTMRIVGQFSDSLTKDLETAKANLSNHVKVGPRILLSPPIPAARPLSSPLSISGSCALLCPGASLPAPPMVTVNTVLCLRVKIDDLNLTSQITPSLHPLLPLLSPALTRCCRHRH